MHTPSKIGQFDKSSGRNHDVLWFDVTMDDAVTVQKTDSVADLPYDALHFLYRHSFSTFLHQRVQSLLARILLDEIDALVIVKDTVQFDDVEIIAEALNLKLRSKSIDYLHLPQSLLFHYFQRIYCPALSFYHFEHLTERSFS